MALSAADKAYYRDVLHVYFYSGSDWAYVPGWGSKREDELPQFFEDRYGSPRPPVGVPALASGVVASGNVWTWWYGPPPDPGTPASQTFRPIMKQPAVGSPSEVFPDLPVIE